MTTSVLLSAGLLVACGGNAKPAPQAPVPEKEHVHPKLPPAVDAFHNVLSPIWHAEPGAVRIQLACERARTLEEHAAVLVTAPPPPEARGPEIWRIATTELASQVSALAAACAAAGQHDVETRLTEVHEGYHKVGTTVAEMGDHGDHRPPGGTGQHGGPGEH